MRVTIDRVGRIVIPKQLRDRVGIGPNSELELTAEDGGLRISPVIEHERVVDAPDGFPRLRAVPGRQVTDEDIRTLRDELQR